MVVVVVVAVGIVWGSGQLTCPLTSKLPVSGRLGMAVVVGVVRVG